MLRSNGFHLIALSGSCSLLAIASPALAQQTAGGEANVSEQVEQQAPGGEIVVTATRRSETLSKVPLAVTAVNAQSLQNSGASDIRQLGQLAPSLMVSSTGTEANGSARVRGVGTVGDNPGLESSVAVFIDGVYRSRSGVALSELGEVERIEVLRGPQGTLFGRNASAGLIHVISKKPSFTFGANAIGKPLRRGGRDGAEAGRQRPSSDEDERGQQTPNHRSLRARTAHAHTRVPVRPEASALCIENDRIKAPG